VRTTLAETRLRVAARLAAAGCESPSVDAELILAHALGSTRSEIRRDGRRELSEGELAGVEALVARREQREPLAYVLGEWGFRRLTLAVDARVLVPRPETEIVVARCLALLRGVERPRVLDVGSGSGAIALAIADEYPGAEVTGVDVSEGALAVGRANTERLGLDVAFELHDLFESLPPGPWDLVVSNPPYVAPDEIDSLAPEVREWEPRVALVGDGATEAVARGARSVLRPGGALVLEVADGTAGEVASLVRGLGYAEVAVTKDLAGRDRVVEGVTTSAVLGA
jgi:release factor glutamine methyltransferase